jgi:DGQHR domain-containing protein
MNSLKAIRLEQMDVVLYLTKFSAGQIRELLNNRQLIVAKYDPADSEGKGYQRVLEPSRVNDIAKFLKSRVPILPPLLPGSLILNCRKKEYVRYDDTKAELFLTEDAVLHVVDGQHRIEGLAKTPALDYDLPVTIIEGLNIPQEAGQFLVINTNQKKVRPDLQLRILYHQDRQNTRKLIDALKIDNWKLEALALCIALNDRNESPWRNLILRPSEKKEGQWKPITEANFVDSLRFFSSKESPVNYLGIDEKEHFLVEYWEAIRHRYEDAFKEDTGRAYALCRGLGAGVFNTLAPAVFNIKSVESDDLNDVIEHITCRFPLRDWDRGRGKMTRYGSGHKVYRNLAEDMVKTVDESLDYVDSSQMSRLSRKTSAQAHKNTLEKARSMLSPLYLRPATDLPEQNWSLRACYSLVNLDDHAVSVYVGKSQNAKKRFNQHQHRDFNLYALKVCGSDREMEYLEMALYHIVKPKVRDNSNHPPPQEFCPYCG